MTSTLATIAWLPVSREVAVILLDAGVKSVAVLALAGIAVACMKKRSAAARHLVCFLAVASLPVLPVLSWTLPGWRVLPGWMDLHTVKPVVIEQLATTDFPVETSVVIPQTPRQIETAIPTISATPEFVPKEIHPIATPIARVQNVAAINPPTPVRSKPNLWRMGLLAWLAGGLLASVPIVLGVFSLYRLGRISRRETASSWLELLRLLLTRLGFKRRATLLKTAQRRMPMTWGVFHPKVLLPEESDRWPEDRRSVVLLHELAHAQRCDYLTHLVTRLVCALYWFNPLVWLAARWMIAERERACDDIVLRHGAEPADYAEQVLEISAGLSMGWFAGYNGVAMARASNLEGRLRAILDRHRNRAAVTRAAVVAAILLLTAIIVPVAMMKAAPAIVPANGTQTDVVARQTIVSDELVPQPGQSSTPSSGQRSDAGSQNWGEIMEGVRVRLHVARTRWGSNEPPQLLVDIANLGLGRVKCSTNYAHWGLKVDGRWYHTVLTESLIVTNGVHGPGPNMGQVIKDLPLKLDTDWVVWRFTNGMEWLEGTERLELAPGKHVVQVRVAGEPDYIWPFRLVTLLSNPLEIEVSNESQTGGNQDEPAPSPNSQSVVVNNQSSESLVTSAATNVPPLERRVSVIARQMPLKDALAELCRQANVELELDEEGLKSAGVSADLAIIISLNNEPLQSALGKLGGELRRQGLWDFLYEIRGQKLFVGGGVQALNVTGIGDAEFEGVLRCRDLRRLEIGFCSLSDAGLAGIGRLKELRQLNLNSEIITDEGIAHLKSLPKLEQLELRCKRISDESLRHLSEIKSLTELTLYSSWWSDGNSWPQLTVEGLLHLKHLPQLRNLTVWGIQSPVGFLGLRELTQLKSLNLEFADITDGERELLEWAMPGTGVYVMSGARYGFPDQRTPRPTFPSTSVYLNGRVLDDATGEAVTNSVLQFGMADPGKPGEVLWGAALPAPLMEVSRNNPADPSQFWGESFRAGKVWARILAGGYAPELLTVNPVESPIHLTNLVVRMKPGSELRGVVVDYRGNPAAGMRVYLADQPNFYLSTGTARPDPDGTAITDAAGRFALTGGNGTEQRVVAASPDGQLFAVAPKVAPSREVTISLPQPTTLILRYDIPDDAPVTRINLHYEAQNLDPELREAFSFGLGPTVTNGQQIVLTNLTPGTYRLTRGKTGMVGNRRGGGGLRGAILDMRTLTLEAGKTQRVDIVRTRGHSVRGEVMGLRATGAPGASIFAFPAGTTNDLVGLLSGRQRTIDLVTCSNDGQFLIGTLEPGDYTVVAVAELEVGWGMPRPGRPDYVGAAEVNITSDSSPPEPLKIELLPWAVATNQPLSNPHGDSSSSRTNSAVRSERFPPNIVTNADSTRTITGHVMDAETRQPIPEFTVTPGYAGAPDLLIWKRAETQRGSNGTYNTHTRVDFDTLLLLVEAPGYAPGMLSIQTNGVLNFELQKGGRVDGTVLDPTGQPVANASVVFRVKVGPGPSQELFPSLRLQAPNTDVNGKFSLPATAGAFSFYAVHERGFAEQRFSKLPLQSDTVIRLKPWARIEGRLLRDGRPLANQSVSIRPNDDVLPYFVIGYADKANTDDSGHFVFEHVPPGKFDLVFKHVPPVRIYVADRWLVETAAAQTTVVELDSSKPDTGSIGNFFELLMVLPQEGLGAYLDLDTRDIVHESPLGDLTLFPSENDLNLRHGLDIVALNVSSNRWNATEAEVASELSKLTPTAKVGLGGSESQTWFIKTHEGSMGVLEILAPRWMSSGEVYVRWRLVKAAVDTSSR